MTGLLVLNFGGPRNLQEVKPFLRQLFSDRDVMQAPAFVRLPLARWIAWRRTKLAQQQYSLIGGGSPINETTRRQAEALGKLLPGVPVRVGFRYSSPTIAQGYRSLREAGADRVIALPLYPHYSHTTTGSSLRVLARVARKAGVFPIKQWFDHPLYVQAMQDRLSEARERFSEPPHLLFSAHGLPAVYVRRGDPYPVHIERSVQLALSGLDGVAGHSLAYQSKVGPVQWLKPYMHDTIKRLAAEGVKRLLVCPLSFVSDHIETLYEIDILYKELARARGIEQFERMESLNLYPPFIEALAAIVSERIRDADEG